MAAFTETAQLWAFWGRHKVSPYVDREMWVKISPAVGGVVKTGNAALANDPAHSGAGLPGGVGR